MTYGAETRALTTQAKNKLAAVQTKMERTMLNITYRGGDIWVKGKIQDGSGPGQNTSAGYEIIDGHFESPPGNLRKEKT